MRLAVALAERAGLNRRVEQLRARIAASARYQEGETPPEDAVALLAEADAALDDLEALVRRINRTNAVTPVDGFGTLTDALARRDVLRLRHGLLAAAAEAAAGGTAPGRLIVRQLRSELPMRAALPVTELRARADRVAAQLRALDALVQQVDWAVELLE